ncbi:MAG: NAD(P)-dependent oxidoreductase [Blautia sp.]|nr:NAD(P)-dependent oxidoreductase [Lachnoclostridium sp.]MCM1212188.1 NAD(P)-dependent oxidoreductase [Blautia sp.]
MQNLTNAKTYEEDSRQIALTNFIEWEKLNGSNILVTGATGLIGATLIRGLMAYNEISGGTIYVSAFVRNTKKAETIFKDYLTKGWMNLIIGDIMQEIYTAGPVDYIIHGASETSSRAFVDQPVETILTTVEGSKNVLELARQKQVKGMVYLSSMETYGTPNDGTVLTEDKMGYLNPLAVRSSYSESKRMAENLCAAYVSEYNIPVKIIRLTQTFGPGISADDERVFAEFARCAMQGKDICLQTEGKTKRMYLYTADAATAILTILTRGKSGEAYNAANAATFCSIREMADMVAEKFGEGKCRVKITIPDRPNASYNPTQEIFMDMSRLESLGWKATNGLEEMYGRMIAGMIDFSVSTNLQLPVYKDAISKGKI